MLNYGIDHVDNGYMINKDGKRVHVMVQYKIYSSCKDDAEPYLIEYSKVFQTYDELDKYLCPYKKTMSKKKVDKYIKEYHAQKVWQKAVEIVLD